MDNAKIQSEITFQKIINGFKYIKTEPLNTLLPLSVIKKYNLKDSVLTAEVPIMFNVKSESFCFFLPDQFLKDINPNELSLDTKNKYVNNDGNQYAYFSFKTLTELRNTFSDENSVFNTIKNKYEEYQLDIQNGELVIFVCFKNQPSTKSFENFYYEFKNDDLKTLILGSSSKFEFFKAFKFNNKYYLLNQDGNVNQKTAFNLNKNKQFEHINYLVIPYTDDDWLLVNKLRDKIINIKDRIEQAFTKQHQIGLLDKSFTDNIPLLESETKRKPKP